MVKNQEHENSMESLWQTFGLGPWDIIIYEPDRLTEVTYYGKSSKSGMKIALYHTGKIQLELIEPIGEDNIYQDFNNKFGAGIQHLGWYKIPTEEKFFSTVERLEKAGFPCIWGGRPL